MWNNLIGEFDLEVMAGLNIPAVTIAWSMLFWGLRQDVEEGYMLCEVLIAFKCIVIALFS